MQDKVQNATGTIAKLLLPAAVFLVAIFFLPMTVDFFDFNKHYLLLVLTTIALITWVVHLLLTRRVVITVMPATAALVLLALVFIISGLVQSPTPYLALTGKAATITALALFFVIVTSLNRGKPPLLITFLALAAAVGLSSLVAIIDYFNLDLPFLPGSLQPSPLSFLGFTLPAVPILFYLAMNHKNRAVKFAFFAAVTLTLSAIAAQISLIFIQKSSLLINLPYQAGWAIAVDIFKSGRSAFLGVGPGNFISAFSRLRPLSLNTHPVFWSFRFDVSSNEFLDILTTAGLLGLLFFGASFYLPIRRALTERLHRGNPLVFAVILGLSAYLVSFFFIPASITSLTVAVCLLVLLCLEMKSRQTEGVYDLTIQPLPTGATVFTWIFCLILLAPTAFFWFYAIRAYAASLATYKAIRLLPTNSVASYEEQIKAYQLAPQNPIYRINFAQTSLALAESLAARPSLTDQDRTTISQLIQQAIRESKMAAQIAPASPVAWENLANTYKRILNFAEGASDWAIASYNQAISLDPTNPRLRLDLGGVFYALSDYDNALRQYDLAETLKPDWANTHYNLAAAYKAKENYAKALASMEKVMNLIKLDSPDYALARAEYDKLKTLAPATPPPASTPPSSQLVTPTPIKPSQTKLDLPAESAPVTDYE